MTGASKRHEIFFLMLLIFPSAADAGGAYAASISATPVTLHAALGSTRPGDTIVLATGKYGMVTISDRAWSSSVTLDARNALFTSLVLSNVDGLIVSGGRVEGPGGRSYGVSIRQSRNIALHDMYITAAHRGVVIDRSQDLVVTGLILERLISDGIDVALSQRILLDSNTCRDFAPTAAIYDSAGNILVDGDHPDCIQAWSRPIAPPTSDLTITNNLAIGRMQGIGLYNGRHDGLDDGGFDRVIITGNTIHNSFPHGIALYSARNSVVRNNEVRSLPGATLPKNGARVNSNISVIGGENNEVCGNIVPDVPRSPAAIQCER